MNNISGYIISESNNFQTPNIIGENKETGRVIIQVTLQDADVVNRNKRVYPKSVLENAIKSEYVQERLATKSWYGEAGHPLKPDVQRQLNTDHSNISHIITKIWWEGNKLKAIVEAAATARGADFDGLIRQGSKVGFSLRAVGPVVEKKGNITYVKDPLTMYCYDWVIHPSHRVAYMDSIVSESTDIFLPIYSEDNNLLTEQTNSILSNNKTKDIRLNKFNNIVISEGTKTKNISINDFVNQTVNSYLANI